MHNRIAEAARRFRTFAIAMLIAATFLPDGNAQQAAPSTRVGSSVPTKTSSTVTWLAGQSATPLADGNWLVLGGADAQAQPTNLAWIVRADGARVPLGTGMSRARSGHSATTLADGRVLILGGSTTNGAVVQDAEVFDPATQQLSVRNATGLLGRTQHSVNLLSDGRLLVAGGLDSRGRALEAAELWNPATGQVERFNARLHAARFKHQASLLPDGTVLLWDGSQSDQRPSDNAEVFDVAAQRFQILPAAQAQALAQALDGTHAPAVQASKPEADARNVAGNQPIVVRFNKRLATSSLTPKSVTLIGPNGAETVSVVAAEQGLLMFVWPGKELLPASRYTLFINGAMDNGQRRLPLMAIGFDTAALGASANALTTLIEAGSASDVGRTGRPSQPTIDAKTLAVMQDDDELFVPGERHRRGEWLSQKADLALQFVPRHAGVRKAVYGLREWEEGRLDRKANAMGVDRKVAHDVGPEKLRSRARLNWADVNEFARDQVQSTKTGSAASGVTALAGQVLRLNGKPLANVTLNINGISARTDDHGEFVVSGIPAGSQVLNIDGRSANRRDATYGVFEYRLDLQAGQTNALPFVIWMPKLDTRHAVKLDSPTKTDVTLTHPLLPGFEVTLPAGTVIRDTDGRIVTEVSITPLPVDQTPFPMPYLGVPLYYTLQPGGAVIQGVDGKPRAATVRYPNYTAFGPGAPMRLFDYDARGRGWYVYSEARVSADGTHVESDRTFQIYQFGATSATSGGPGGGGGGADGCGGGGSGGGGGGGWGQGSDAGGGVCGGDPIDLSTGHFAHIERDLYIEDVSPIDIRRTYRTMDNAGSANQYVRAFGMGTTHPYEIYLYLPAPTYSEVQVVMPNGRVVRFPSELGTQCCYVSKPFKNVDASGEFHGSYIQYSSSEGALILYFRDGHRWAFQSYNARLKWMEDGNGNRTLVERPTSNSYTSRVVSPSGRFVSFSYNSLGLISQISDNIGRSFSYTYDSTGRLSEVTDPANQKRTYTWDTVNNRILSIKDPNGTTRVTNEYDTAGRVSKQTLADGSTFQLAYTTDTSNRITRTDLTDRRGSVRRVQFDSYGQVTTNTFPLGQPEERVTSYNVTYGLTSLVNDALNRQTAYEFDTVGNPTKMTRLAGTPDAVSVSMTWNATLGRPLTYTDANGHTTSMEYDLKGNLTKVTNPLVQATTIAYNGQGKPVLVTDPLGRQTSMSYFGPDLASLTDPLTRQTQFFTDNVGRLVTRTDALGNRSLQEWDSLNRMTRITDEVGQTIQFTYDANGNVLTQVDQKGNSTAFSYNALSKVSGMTDALLQAESSLYEPGGRIRQRIDRKGQLSAVTYDAAGRVKTVAFGASTASPTAYRSVIELTWDKGNRLTQIVDKTCADPATSLNCSSVASSRTTTRSFDGLDRLIQEVTPQGEVNYTYDAGGRRLTMVVKNGAPGSQTTQPTISYTWDNADRLTSITQAAGAPNGNVAQSITLAYDAAGRRTRTTLANGATIDYGYDAADQLTGLTYKKSDGTLIGDLGYTYDANGRRTGAGGSLARINLPASDVTDALYDANNRLTQWGGKAFSYDANGNLLADGTHSYQWDERNQFAGLSAGATQLASFSYDSLGRRTGKTVGGATTGYLYDGQNFAQELLGTSNTSAVKSQLLTGGIDETFLRIEGSSRSSFLTDGNNNTVRLLDANQAKTVDYSYEPYGTTTADAANGNTQHYTGRENDNPGNDNGLYYYRARYYMPGCGRFISEDPIGWASGQTNSYAYVGGDPVGLTDPTGLKTFSACETSGFFSLAQKQSLPEAFQNHRGEGKFDFAYGPNRGDRWTIGPRTYNSNEFGNVLAGYTGGYKLGATIGGLVVNAAGIGANFGDNFRDSDLDASSRPYINLGVALGSGDATSGQTTGASSCSP